MKNTELELSPYEELGIILEENASTLTQGMPFANRREGAFMNGWIRGR